MLSVQLAWSANNGAGSYQRCSHMLGTKPSRSQALMLGFLRTYCFIDKVHLPWERVPEEAKHWRVNFLGPSASWGPSAHGHKIFPRLALPHSFNLRNMFALFITRLFGSHRANTYLYEGLMHIAFINKMLYVYLRYCISLLFIYKLFYILNKDMCK